MFNAPQKPAALHKPPERQGQVGRRGNGGSEWLGNVPAVTQQGWVRSLGPGLTPEEGDQLSSFPGLGTSNYKMGRVLGIQEQAGHLLQTRVL